MKELPADQYHYFGQIILPSITNNIEQLDLQHGFKTSYSTTTALHKIGYKITEGFNKKYKSERTVFVTLDRSKAFDAVNIHKLITRLLKTNIPNNIIKFLFNHLKSQQAFTILQNVKSKTQNWSTTRRSSISNAIQYLYVRLT